MLQRAAADLYEKFPDLVKSGLKPFGLLLLEERATTAQLIRALREATEKPAFMGGPVVAAPPTTPQSLLDAAEKALKDWYVFASALPQSIDVESLEWGAMSKLRAALQEHGRKV
jgi:hypothetical protein